MSRSAARHIATDVQINPTELKLRHSIPKDLEIVQAFAYRAMNRKVSEKKPGCVKWYAAFDIASPIPTATKHYHAPRKVAPHDEFTLPLESLDTLS